MTRQLIPRRLLPPKFNVVPETIRRWRLDPKLNFPKPAAVINGREYYDEAELANWQAAQAVDENSPSAA
jgi:hypothetical protein